ncbi:two-component sensor histidine kinase, partial [Candidatus Sumerlaeota bacterium]|nr:two-component sensor histidine kinase [Candidatus Sumerlaeota bacterium]
MPAMPEPTDEYSGGEDDRLRQERLAVLGQLAGSVAHELRNPLAVISNAVFYLQSILKDADKPVIEYLAIIAGEVERAARIVNDLLDIARTRQADRQEVSVASLLRLQMEKNPPPANVEVLLKAPDSLLTVFVDPMQISQVLSNLISNAYQSMTQGGRLAIEAVCENDCVAIAIRDTGCGISKANLEKIFEPLFTTRARGVGLGLTVARNLVEANQGWIEAES